MQKNNIDWGTVRINAAISVMQGLMENGKVSTALDIMPRAEAAIAVHIADALVDELKKPRRYGTGDNVMKRKTSSLWHKVKNLF